MTQRIEELLGLLPPEQAARHRATLKTVPAPKVANQVRREILLSRLDDLPNKETAEDCRRQLNSVFAAMLSPEAVLEHLVRIDILRQSSLSNARLDMVLGAPQPADPDDWETWETWRAWVARSRSAIGGTGRASLSIGGKRKREESDVNATLKSRLAQLKKIEHISVYLFLQSTIADLSTERQKNELVSLMESLISKYHEQPLKNTIAELGPLERVVLEAHRSDLRARSASEGTEAEQEALSRELSKKHSSPISAIKSLQEFRRQMSTSGGGRGQEAPSEPSLASRAETEDQVSSLFRQNGWGGEVSPDEQ